MSLFGVLQTVEYAVASAGVGVTLVPADALHGQTAETPTLAQGYALAVADAAHAHSADSPTLTFGTVDLVVADATHGHSADAPALSLAYSIIVADAQHALSSDAPTPTVAFLLTPADAAHATSSDVPTVAISFNLAVADGTHVLSSEELTVVQTSFSITPTTVTQVGGYEREDGSTTEAALLAGIESASDSLYVRSPTAPAGTEFRLGFVSLNTRPGLKLKYQYGKEASNSETLDQRIELRKAGALVTGQTHNDVGVRPIDGELDLTGVPDLSGVYEVWAIDTQP